MKSILLGLGLSVLMQQASLAAPASTMAPLAPQPSSCIGGRFSSTGDAHWQSIALKITNHCGTPVDFQSSSITFENSIALNTNFWGDFDSLSYPDNELVITSQKQPNNNFLATINLHFPSYSGANSILAADRSFVIQYGAARKGYNETSVAVYLGNPVATGSIQLTNSSPKPNNVTDHHAIVHLTTNGNKVTDIQLPWGASHTVSGLAPATYNVAADHVSDTDGYLYQGSATPSSIVLKANALANTTIAYKPAPQTGKLAVQLQRLPVELTGYSGRPSVLITQTDNGSSQSTALDWNTTSTLANLTHGKTYRFATPTITFHDFQCTASFSPTTLVASATSLPVTKLTYTCNQVSPSTVTLNVRGAPATLAALRMTLTPNNNSAAVTKTISLSNGSGTDTVLLTTGTIYTLSSEAVAGYTITFNPQPLSATDNAVATISLAAGTPVAINGQLKVCGTQLCNASGTPIQLKGMSSHGLQWYGWGSCLTAASLDALVNNIKANVIRLSLYVQEGGYDSNPTGFTQQVNLLINEAYKRGIYAIVDWHMLNPGDPNINLTKAKKFFTDIINANKDKTNLIFEIANEPNGVAWPTIKRYADELIPVIRALDSKAVVIVGTPGWSSLGISDGSTSQEIINNPVTFPNIMYTFHFYAASHRDLYLNELDRASNKLPIFVTEWGTQTYDGDGANDLVMSEKYTQLMARKKIGWTSWNYSDDFRSGAIWKTGTCSSGQWTDSNLKPAGAWIKSKIKE